VGALRLASRVEVFHFFAPPATADFSSRRESRNIIRKMVLVLLVDVLLVAF
jgi:hypothetical protein